MWGKLELARTFFAMEEYSLAREHFEQVLANHKIPPYLSSKVQSLLMLLKNNVDGQFLAILIFYMMITPIIAVMKI